MKPAVIDFIDSGPFRTVRIYVNNGSTNVHFLYSILQLLIYLYRYRKST